MRFLVSSPSSAKVASKPSGTNSGSYPKPARPRADSRMRPSHAPEKIWVESSASDASQAGEETLGNVLGTGVQAMTQRNRPRRSVLPERRRSSFELLAESLLLPSAPVSSAAKRA